MDRYKCHEYLVTAHLKDPEVVRQILDKWKTPKTLPEARIPKCQLWNYTPEGQGLSLDTMCVLYKWR